MYGKQKLCNVLVGMHVIIVFRLVKYLTFKHRKLIIFFAL